MALASRLPSLPRLLPPSRGAPPGLSARWRGVATRAPHPLSPGLRLSCPAATFCFGFRRGAPLYRTRFGSISDVAHLHPLLGVNIAQPTVAHAPRLESERRARTRTALSHFKQLPVSPKKLRVVANLVPGLYVREAMAQLEFCSKNIAIFVKNAIENAVLNARTKGLATNQLIVDTISVGKGSHVKGIDYKSKGRAGVKKRYKAHLRVVVKEVSVEELEKTRYFSRWRKAENLLSIPWEERVKSLPRYKPIPGYDPGTRRLPHLTLPEPVLMKSLKGHKSRQHKRMRVVRGDPEQDGEASGKN
ncbi:hypothetical protein AB1Y20_002416 [Prymnesium parvum]|uniref:50S ribosomal protein L22, chloroplastic n=1 Tax=Prymnesium parvum TaxID=97485 RepID=A0AB34JAA6_PRYPA